MLWIIIQFCLGDFNSDGYLHDLDHMSGWGRVRMMVLLCVVKQRRHGSGE